MYYSHDVTRLQKKSNNKDGRKKVRKGILCVAFIARKRMMMVVVVVVVLQWPKEKRYRASLVLTSVAFPLAVSEIV